MNISLIAFNGAVKGLHCTHSYKPSLQVTTATCEEKPSLLHE